MRSGLRGCFAAAALAALALCGCVARNAPYRFRAPLLDSVAAARIELPAPGAPTPGTTAPGADPNAAPPAAVRHGSRHTRASRRIHHRWVQVTPERADTLTATLPARIASPAPRGGSLADMLRGLVGTRDARSTSVAFAVRAIARLGVHVDADLRGTRSGRDLVSMARARRAFSHYGRPLLGDLVVFDDVVPHHPASLVGVVVGVDGRGVIEFVYLARKVVRRGFACPEHPREQRDRRGRILNTFLRTAHNRDPRDGRYLAGRLLAGVIRLDKLAR